MCVALSRAMSGLIIVANAGMVADYEKSKASDYWATLVSLHRAYNALVPLTVSDADIRRDMGIPGNEYIPYLKSKRVAQVDPQKAKDKLQAHLRN